ncbi:hypothetical protein [Oceanobacillus damuensis]|uniref:hypothetical protein n=1 Tax=Oceanobacillus damuensis TaxID=937928 RepID=UPI0008303D9B|nr:hypothetical protein [Oceanobacillus damuensis]
MTTDELVVECKKGLNIAVDNTELDGILKQKIIAVKSFLKNGGVSEEVMATDDAIGVIVVGVTDLWELKAGEVKFSPVFFTLATQLASG